MLRPALLCLTLAACGQPDKAAHFAAGAGAAVIAAQVWPDEPLAPCLAAFGLGIAKEAWDATGRGNVEALDALATGAGCALVIEF